jgi:hypothetical protein
MFVAFRGIKCNNLFNNYIEYLNNNLFSRKNRLKRLFLSKYSRIRMLQLNPILQIAIARLLLLVCILLARHSKSGLTTWAGIGFSISIFCYLIVSEAIQSTALLRIIVSIGANFYSGFLLVAVACNLDFATACCRPGGISKIASAISAKSAALISYFDRLTKQVCFYF